MLLTFATRMKCLISPTIFSPFSSSTQLTKKPSTLTLFSLASNFTRKSSPQNQTLMTKSASAFPVQNRGVQRDASSSSSSGEIHVIVGPMFAGKTTSLLRRVQAEQLNGRKVAIIKSDKDTRYGLDSVVTHDGMKLPCLALGNLSSFRQNLGHDAYDQLDVIGIDEAQFFEDLYDFCREAADHDGKTVIVAGLDGDYLRRRFGSLLDIIRLADSVTKLTARCELCGKRAVFTLRKTDETQTELIGGAEVYMPVCRQHYVSGQAVIETTKSVLKSQRVQCNSCI